MAFFSWFKSKSGNRGQNEPEKHQPAKPAAELETLATSEGTDLRQPIPQFRETVPQGVRTVSGSSTFKRPVRATMDIPLQTLWQSLPEDLAQRNPSLDPKRRIPIPRKEVRINDTEHTGTVNLYVLRSVCPDIFATPVPSLHNRSVKFPLPAWERLRNVEVVEVNTAPEPSSDSGEPTLAIPADEKTGSSAPEPADQTEQHRAQESVNLSETLQPIPTVDDKTTQPLEVHSNGSDRGQNLRIALSPILRELPPELNRAALHNIAGSNSEIELPLALIQPQLPNGRVTIPLSVFLEALPETVRNAFGEVDRSTHVTIPLKEIFRHLPSDALPLRADQEIDEVRDPIHTPFTNPAREDAERFRNATGIAEKSNKESPQAEFDDSSKSDQIAAQPDTPEPATPPAVTKTEPDFSSLQTIFLTDERLDLPTIVDKISALPGLQGALVYTADGGRLSGALGDDQFEQATLTLLPTLFGEIKAKLDERECRGLETLTFCWLQEQISIFSDGRLCLSVRHSRRPFKPGVREKLSLIFSRLAEALSSSEV
jgi:hypothetical protein